ncbi:DNA-deoxyinosine glycosylase [Sphingosinicella sp. BN140058]|uniref:DNA-deoxyinosine glycosylase n=1 Tax=Sphingosinicella sp. BN140058 TaxID=1892855 RepID=UPI001981D932|nr:DNA-deoxyinosine glycosylase [Sphingosinicella sp. BN140058]
MDEVKRSFPPVLDARTRVLVLGSLPGELSLAAQRYYGNPRNHFWHLIGGVIEADLVSLPYPQRLERLLAAGIGLWDTIGAAKRRGSLDTAIREPVGNDVATLAAELPSLRAIGFNGAKSAAIGIPQLAQRGDLALLPLPSSSPAFTLPLTEKAVRWAVLRDYL